ncbi:N-acetyltransferase, partial [Endozoicomonas sp. SM1973]|nr:N-acetyltransferase [Spartinivicinus marinus]
MPIIIEPINKQHNRKDFDCGVTELNQFLQQQARQKAAKQIAKTYVACQDSAPTTILGYYTLTGYSVITPPTHKDYKKYPHPLSAVKLARLAVDRSQQGQCLGEKLLVDAVYRTV